MAGADPVTRKTCPRCHRAILVYEPIMREGALRLRRVAPPMFRKHRRRPREGALCLGSYTFVGGLRGVA